MTTRPGEDAAPSDYSEGRWQRGECGDLPDGQRAVVSETPRLATQGSGDCPKW